MNKLPKKSFLKETLIIVFILILTVSVVFYFKNKNDFLKEQKNQPSPSSSIVEASPTPTIEENSKEIIPATYRIDNIPFTPQAPFAKWDFDHNEACEEAAILMVHYFYKGKSLTPEIADKEIMGMINYQKQNWQGHFDLEAKDIAKLAKEYYSYKNAKVIYSAAISDIKKEVAKGNPVIIPTAGRLLGNPYYKSPGPIYHALVVIGYTESEIITNDPGTKRGKDYSYKNEVILNAMHEWNGGNVNSGRKTIIILAP